MSLQAGNTDHDTELEDYSLSRFESDLAQCQAFKAEAVAMLERKDITESERLNLDLLVAELDTFINGYRHKG